MSRSALLLLVAALAACGGGDNSPTTPPPQVVVSISPSSATVNAGATSEFSATVANATSTAVTWTASAGSITPNGSSASWTAPGVGGSYTVTATSTADPSKSASASITVNPVGLTLNPATLTVGAGDTVPVAVTVANAANTAVTWAASAGSIIGSGSSVQWAAPLAGGSYTITATSVLDPARRVTLNATVTPVNVAVVATTSALLRTESTSITATVTGTSVTGVRWQASCGSVNGGGATVQYTAPASGSSCVVRATSVRDTSRSGSTTITVRPVYRVAVLDDSDDGVCSLQHCSLREAINAANANANRDSILVVTTAPTTITLGSELPAITADIDLLGAGPTQLIVNAAATQAAQRGVLYVRNAADVSIRGMTLRGGRRPGGGGLVIDDSAAVTMREVHVRENETVGSVGGGILAIRGGRGVFTDIEVVGNRATGTNAFGAGVAVEVGSSITMRRSLVADNVNASSIGGGLRVFSGTLTLDSVTVANNRALSATAGFGGGIMADGEARLIVSNSTISDNVAGVSGGGFNVRAPAEAGIVNSVIRGNRAPGGAGLEGNSPAYVLSEVIIENNIASQRGGAALLFGGKFTQTGGAMRNNYAGRSGGGAVNLITTAELVLTNVALTGNRADTAGNGGAIAGSGEAKLAITGGSITGNRAAVVGGGLAFSSGRPSTLTNVTVADNEAGQGGGGLFIAASANLTVSGGAISTNRAVAGGGGGVYTDNSTTLLQNVTMTGNSAVQSGGAVLGLTGGTVTLRNVLAEENRGFNGGAFGFNGPITIAVEGGRVQRNQATGVGGGLWKAGQTALTVTGTEFTENTAATQGGGLQLVGPGAPATLRGLLVRGNTATVSSGGGVTAGVNTTIDNSTFVGNSAAAAIGGGIFSASTANTTIRNSTFSGNSAAAGGGVAATGAVALINSTFVGNSATDYGAGIATNNAGAMTATNLVLSNNRIGQNAGDCGRGGTSTITSAGGNVNGDTTCTTFTQASDRRSATTGVSATLANNGGGVLTHALLEGSAAINAGVASACPATDQRGFARVGACDSGAFEFGAIALAGARLIAQPVRK
jgi:CSLREA domain-containing protein